MRRWPALDGVRGIAILLVMMEHAHLAPFHGGGFGVDLFFVLSGFLITGLLVAENDRTGRLDIPRFYARRALRLLPALFLLVSVTTVAAVLFRGHQMADSTLAETPGTLLYFANVGRTDVGSPGLLGHTWSLSVEEQFYVVWPFVLLLLLGRFSRRGTTIGILLVAVAFAVERTVTYLLAPDTPDGFGAWYFRTDTKVDGLLLGAAIALGVSARAFSRVRQSRALPVLGLVSLVALLGVVPLVDLTRVQFMGQLTVFRLASGGLILAVVLGWLPRWMERGLSARGLRLVGVLSYSLYLWHYPVFAVTQHWYGRTVKSLVLEVPVTLVLASFSYYAVERPCLRARGRLPWSRAPHPTVAAEPLHATAS